MSLRFHKKVKVSIPISKYRIFVPKNKLRNKNARTEQLVYCSFFHCAQNYLQYLWIRSNIVQIEVKNRDISKSERNLREVTPPFYVERFS